MRRPCFFGALLGLLLLAGCGFTPQGDAVRRAVAEGLVYYRHPEPLPVPGDVEALGHYYKKYFNTALGKGSAEEFVRNYKRHVMK